MSTTSINTNNAGPSTEKRMTKGRRSSSSSSSSNQNSRQDSIGGAIIRSLIGTLAFLFKRPVRLFRPVKLSSWTILEAMAKREGRSLSLRYLRTLLRRENLNFLPHLLLPPLLFNTAIGFTLFEAYSVTESRLLANTRRQERLAVAGDEKVIGVVEEREGKSEGKRKPEWTPLWIVTVSGAVAGAAQCFLSAPLDNVRYIIQRNVSGSDLHHQHNSIRPITTISWRAILRAAILPFAPAIARDKLVKSVQNETIERSKRAPQRSLRSRLLALIEPATSSLNKASVGESFTMSPEKRKEWEKRLKRWRGGVHGSGLMLSLIRDSVGFASFFFIFEVSRRCAFAASTGVDRVSGWLNAKGLGLVRSRGGGEGEGSNVVRRRKSDVGQGDGEVYIEDSRVSHWIREGQRNVKDADVSYNQSRTVQGRVVAVIILLVGGAVGAFSYELVGRPFELMRVVIWEGRKQWEQGKREPGYSRSARSSSTTRHRSAKAQTSEAGATGFTTTGRSAVKGARVNAIARIEQLGPKAFRQRPGLIVLRTLNTSGNNVSRIYERAKIPRAAHPLRLVAASREALRGNGVRGTVGGMLTTSYALQRRKVRRTSTSQSSESQENHSPAIEKRKVGRKTRTLPTLSTRPDFLTLLIEHAQTTAKLDRLDAGGGADPSKASIPLLLLHTYFIAPFLPEIPKPVLDNEITRTAAGVDKHLQPSSPSSSSSSSPSKTTVENLREKVSTLAQRTLLMSLASRRRSADSPEAKLKKNWIRNNPVNFSLASQTIPGQKGRGEGGGKDVGRRGGFGESDRQTLQKGTRYWASGRVVWALKRLATPYGVGFLVFAWLGGDLN